MRWPSTPDLVTGIECAALSGGRLDNHPNFLKERHGSTLRTALRLVAVIARAAPTKPGQTTLARYP
jgi:hypothetical protein